MERAAKLACEAVDECRVQLMLKFRFLDLALWRMPLEPVYLRTRYPLATDARAVFLEPGTNDVGVAVRGVYSGTYCVTNGNMISSGRVMNQPFRLPL